MGARPARGGLPPAGPGASFSVWGGARL